MRTLALLAAAIGSLCLAGPASAERSTVGAWQVDLRRSELDGATTGSASVLTTNTNPDTLGREVRSELSVVCLQTRGRPVVGVVLDPRALVTTDRVVAVRYRFDDRPIRTMDWQVSARGAVMLLPGVTTDAFIYGLQHYGRLVMQLGARELVFDLNGGDAAVAPVAAACNPN